MSLGRIRAWSSGRPPWHCRLDGSPLITLLSLSLWTSLLLLSLCVAYPLLTYDTRGVYDWGTRVIVSMQGSSTSAGRGFFQFMSWMGSPFYPILILIVMYLFDMMLGLRLLAMVAYSTHINNLLKQLFRAPRPYWYSPQVRAFVCEVQYGRPSGHSEGAASLYLLLALHFHNWHVVEQQPARRRVVLRVCAWGLAILMVFLIGYSRVYNGAHFPDQVLLGWLTGGLDLCVFLWIDRIIARLQPTLIATRIVIISALSLLISALFLGVDLGAYFITDAVWDLPAAWVSNVAAQCPNKLIDVRGALDGMLAGLAILTALPTAAEIHQRYLYLRAADTTWGTHTSTYPWWKRLLTLLISIACAVPVGLALYLPAKHTHSITLKVILEYYLLPLFGLLALVPLGLLAAFALNLIPSPWGDVVDDVSGDVLPVAVIPTLKTYSMIRREQQDNDVRDVVERPTSAI